MGWDQIVFVLRLKMLYQIYYYYKIYLQHTCVHCCWEGVKNVYVTVRLTVRDFINWDIRAELSSPREFDSPSSLFDSSSFPCISFRLWYFIKNCVNCQKAKENKQKCQVANSREDKYMFALLKSNPTFQRVFAPISSQIPLFGGFLPRFAVTDETVSAFIPPICALFKQTKLRFFQKFILTYLNLRFCCFCCYYCCCCAYS